MLPKLPHIKYVKKGGRVYAYFNTGAKVEGKPVYKRLPHPSASGFFESYAALKAVRAKRELPSYTMALFIGDYMKSPAYADRAPATRESYRYQLEKLGRILGEFPLSRIEAHHLRTIVEKEDWGAATKNLFIATVSALYKWGRKTGRTTLSPMADVDKYQMGQHEPWPEGILEAALSSDNQTIRLAVHVLYFTGLRIGDVCALRWNDIRNSEITFMPSKTKRFRKTLYIPLAGELKSELDATPKRGLTVITMTDGRPVKADWLREQLQGFTKALGAETVPHGLRKNAVIALLEAGCTIAETASITGQTMAIIEHYAARVNNRRLGQAAMLKFDSQRQNKSGTGNQSGNR